MTRVRLPKDLIVAHRVDDGSLHMATSMIDLAIDLVREGGPGKGRPGRATFRTDAGSLVLARVPVTGSVRMNARSSSYGHLNLHDHVLLRESGDLRKQEVADRLLRTWRETMYAPVRNADRIAALLARRRACEERVLRWWRAASAARGRQGSRRITFGWSSPHWADVEITGHEHGNVPQDEAPNAEIASHPALATAPRSIRLQGTSSSMRICTDVTSHDGVGATDVLTALRDLADPEIAHPATFTVSQEDAR